MRVRAMRVVKRNGPVRTRPCSRPMNRTVCRGLSAPFFPLTFFLRNVERVARSEEWKRLPLRKRKDYLYRLLVERTSFFLRVRDWAGEKEERRSWVRLTPDKNSIEPSSYCDHCGRCCEVASGYPDFPTETKIPSEWREIFGNGLGKGHWFCAFLWEVNGSGRSLCAIHPWRSKPCRLFEEDECEYLKEDPAFPGPSVENGLGKWYRLMTHLVNRR